MQAIISISSHLDSITMQRMIPAKSFVLFDIQRTGTASTPLAFTDRIPSNLSISERLR